MHEKRKFEELECQREKQRNQGLELMALTSMHPPRGRVNQNSPLSVLLGM